MRKFKVGDIVSTSKNPDRLYKILECKPEWYIVECIPLSGPRKSFYLETTLNYTHRPAIIPSIEQTILLTKLGLI